MRLTESQRVIIRTTVDRVLGGSARVWLFGSRVDDNVMATCLTGVRYVER